jgi:hypothetical protein
LEALFSCRRLSIANNNSLLNLDGLSGLHSVSELLSPPDLSIYNNANLPMCEATELQVQLQSYGWFGSSDFYNNDGTGTCD